MYFDTPAPFLYVKEWHTDPLRITKDNLTFVILNYEVAMSGWPVSAKQIKQKLKAIICPHATSTLLSKV